MVTLTLSQIEMAKSGINLLEKLLSVIYTVRDLAVRIISARRASKEVLFDELTDQTE